MATLALSLVHQWLDIAFNAGNVPAAQLQETINEACSEGNATLAQVQTIQTYLWTDHYAQAPTAADAQAVAPQL